eukprot:5620168-Pleurochrysis_carterae.AAC.7
MLKCCVAKVWASIAVAASSCVKCYTSCISGKIEASLLKSLCVVGAITAFKYCPDYTYELRGIQNVGAVKRCMPERNYSRSVLGSATRTSIDRV